MWLVRSVWSKRHVREEIGNALTVVSSTNGLSQYHTDVNDLGKEREERERERTEGEGEK